MSEEKRRRETIHLSEEELLGKLPKRVGGVTLDYRFYPGEDLYSDGEIEDEILSIVKEASRVEYPSIIEEKKSWPILYHLSPLRGNIVDWLPIEKTHKVLEIGSGCGVITEKLSEKAGKVTCVDLSAKRSLVNAYRNQDKDNIEILLGNFQDIEPSLETDYDMACLIGVFEYGSSYIHSETPYEDFLRIIRRHVKNNGRIVIAIENKFGLKYWAGCKEDHLGTYFSGLEGYPEGGSARTFTRPGLEQIFAACGEKEYSFYYPYPDYKFPTTLYSDKRLPQTGELTDNLRNFDRDRMVLFNEKYVYDGAIRDFLFPVFSNSYLAVLGKDTDTAYVKYSNDRAPEFMVKTEIKELPDGSKVVHKLPMTEEAREHIRGMARAYELLKERYEGSGISINPCRVFGDGAYAEFPFEKGITLEELLDRCLEKDDREAFEGLFERYCRLIAYGEEKEISDYDLIFANILVDGDKWTVIDYEWTMEKAIPWQEIAFRALYCYVLEEEKRNKLNLDSIISQLGVTPQQAQEYREKEAGFQKQVTGKRKSMGEILALLGTYHVDPKVLMEQHLQKILDQRIQVYFDRGKGFSESDSVYLPDVYTGEFTIETELPVDGNVRALRIDPADRPCCVRFTELVFNGVSVALNKKWVETNGRTLKDGGYVFATGDPNIVIHVAELPMRGENRLDIKMEIAPLPQGVADSLSSAVKKLF